MLTIRYWNRRYLLNTQNNEIMSLIVCVKWLYLFNGHYLGSNGILK